MHLLWVEHLLITFWWVQHSKLTKKWWLRCSTHKGIDDCLWNPYFNRQCPTLRLSQIFDLPSYLFRYLYDCIFLFLTVLCWIIWIRSKSKYKTKATVIRKEKESYKWQRFSRWWIRHRWILVASKFLFLKIICPLHSIKKNQKLRKSTNSRQWTIVKVSNIFHHLMTVQFSNTYKISSE